MRAAAEAMVEALVVVDGEARRLLVVERAARLPLAPGADQLHRRRDDCSTARSERGARRERLWRGSREPPTACGRGLGGGCVGRGSRAHPFAAARALPLPQAVGVVASNFRGSVFELRQDDLQYAVCVLQDIIVPEPKNGQAIVASRNAVRHSSCAARSACCPPSSFDDEALLAAEEIANERPDGHLTART